MAPPNKLSSEVRFHFISSFFPSTPNPTKLAVTDQTVRRNNHRTKNQRKGKQTNKNYKHKKTKKERKKKSYVGRVQTVKNAQRSVNVNSNAPPKRPTKRLIPTETNPCNAQTAPFSNS